MKKKPNKNHTYTCTFGSIASETTASIIKKAQQQQNNNQSGNIDEMFLGNNKENNSKNALMHSYIIYKPNGDRQATKRIWSNDLMQCAIFVNAAVVAAATTTSTDLMKFSDKIHTVSGA